MEFEKLKEITDLRKYWKNEAYDFTPWLCENIHLLGDELGIDIEVEESESDVGDFSLDIYAKEINTDKNIIIENQLEDTNHDHLGKLITYASGKDANIVIWIVKRAREEHRSAIQWLNNHIDSNIDFFLCEIKIYKIGDSNPAVKFEIVEKPNDWSKETKKITNRDINSENCRNRLEYWTAFKNYLEKNGYDKRLKISKPGPYSWFTLNLGKKYCTIGIDRLIKYNKLTIDLHIKKDKDFYDILFTDKGKIENIIGKDYIWQRELGKDDSRIIKEKENVEFLNKSDWENQFEWIIQNALKIKEAITPYLK